MGKIFITGAAGFVGSNLVDRLLDLGMEIVGWDNFSTGRRAFLAGALKHGNFSLVEGDTLDPTSLCKAMVGCDTVFHLCANADVRFGTSHPRRDLEQNTIATHNEGQQDRENHLRLHRLRLRRDRCDPDTRACSLSRPDIPVWRFKTCLRRFDSGVLRGFRN